MERDRLPHRGARGVRSHQLGRRSAQRLGARPPGRASARQGTRRASKARVSPFEHLLSPGRIGTLELRNRILMALMGEELAELDGTVGDRQLAYVEARAAGGAALVSLGSVAIAWPAGTANECQNG